MEFTKGPCELIFMVGPSGRSPGPYRKHGRKKPQSIRNHAKIMVPYRTVSPCRDIVLYCAIQSRTVSYRIAVPYRIVPYRCIVSYRIVPYRTVSYRIVLYRCTVLYRIVAYRTVSLYRIVPYRIVPYVCSCGEVSST